VVQAGCIDNAGIRPVFHEGEILPRALPGNYDGELGGGQGKCLAEVNGVDYWFPARLHNYVTLPQARDCR